MSGYTDEALEEGHDLIYRAEEEAHMHDDDLMMGKKTKKGAGLESSSPSSGMQSSSNQGSESMKSKLGSKMDSLKESMKK
ncbi:hypothetical protein B0T17DRAFT_614403 [Bombardia bombarda]|uniref:Uncharacterized protein n=1 Tax=Bombardia bombarda TaxID=252184 RepID=A0AA39X718_9PEZI|nr:hypothetical protein B0T17DRAFT_614403 [Bombardia bombarda]